VDGGLTLSKMRVSFSICLPRTLLALGLGLVFNADCLGAQYGRMYAQWQGPDDPGVWQR